MMYTYIHYISVSLYLRDISSFRKIGVSVYVQNWLILFSIFSTGTFISNTIKLKIKVISNYVLGIKLFQNNVDKRLQNKFL